MPVFGAVIYMDWSAAEAMKAIGIPEEKWQEYEKKLNESQE